MHVLTWSCDHVTDKTCTYIYVYIHIYVYIYHPMVVLHIHICTHTHVWFLISTHGQGHMLHTLTHTMNAHTWSPSHLTYMSPTHPTVETPYPLSCFSIWIRYQCTPYPLETPYPLSCLAETPYPLSCFSIWIRYQCTHHHVPWPVCTASPYPDDVPAPSSPSSCPVSANTSNKKSCACP